MNENKAYVFRGHTNANWIDNSKSGAKVDLKLVNKENLKSPWKPIGDFWFKGELDWDGSEYSSLNRHSNCMYKKLTSNLCFT